MNKTVRVELTVVADVTVTDEMRAGMMDQYARSYADANDKKMAEGMLYASINPKIPTDNCDFDDFWDGVGNMRGLIRNIEVE